MSETVSHLQPLAPEKLRFVCNVTLFDFESTAELEVNTRIIGQPRGTRAIAFGVEIQSEGYNIFAVGATGTGRTTAIAHFLRKQAKDKPIPDDWLYVHHFAIPHQPRAISLSAGDGEKFQTRMRKLIQDLRRELPQAFDSETYQETIAAVSKEMEEQQNTLLGQLSKKAQEQGFALTQTPSGFMIAPTVDGRQLSPQELNQMLQQMPPDQQAALQETLQGLMEELNAIGEQLHEMDLTAQQQMKEVDHEVATAAVQRHFDDIKEAYKDYDEVMEYLEEVHKDVLTQISDFAPPVDTQNTTEEIDLRRYEVNLLVNNVDAKGMPVIRESNPTFHGLFGRIEYEMASGHVFTHFTNIKCGSLHWANGGYLIINGHDLFKNPAAWPALKRALKEQKIYAQPPALLEQGQVMAKSLDPEPIPLSVKIILTGSLSLYYMLYAQDEDFASLFKVRADFNTSMPREEDGMWAYANFIAGRCQEEDLHHFDHTAVAKIVEHGSRLANDQRKLSTRFGEIADLVREASYWAGDNDRDTVSAADVQQALEERIFRVNRAESEIFEYFLDETIFVATDGRVVGQVNGLSVLNMGDYAFGQPGRITVRTYMGDDGITHIERETEMSGPIHEKGVLTLQGYLGGTYAQNQPLSLNASITFEQNYSGVDGDSASSTELYALLSSLSRRPIKQGIAVTGSVNQRGEVQPIGGVNEKIEGFFRLCQARGLTGKQGVMIPASNMDNLMLHEDVITAVSQNKFHIWPVTTIDEGIELLMDFPAGVRGDDGRYPEGTVHHLVQTHLLQLAQGLKDFGDDDEDGTDSVEK
ncbi:MAG: AAA family ATPase [Chloroflexi bacterium]|nr:AAA family ATPase [Chloroflexota bacterium]